MVFHSSAFLVFFAVVFCTYWLLSGTARLALCLAASLFFYGWWDYRFLSLILFSVLVDYIVGLRLAATTDQRLRRGLVAVSLVSNLGLLATFKYFHFFSESLTAACQSIGWQLDWPTLNIVLPIGISFYTFQTLSYTIDVYRRQISPERSLLKFATYVTFFPQLVAGPIVRAKEFLPQLQVDRKWSYANLEAGFGLVLLGFFKKLVIADNIAVLVDHLFESPELFTAVNTLIVIVLYAFQIYGDFSGYSDIAIGLALMMGFVFPVNFRFPYFAKSFSDFWTRWHITLSQWLRDYLYIPLGGNRGSRWATVRNLMTTMLLGGLWHGANWTFLAWGGLHGLFLVGQHGLTGREKKTTPSIDSPSPAVATMEEASQPSSPFAMLQNGLQIALVFAAVCLAWVLFRGQSFDQSWRVLSQIPGLDGFHPSTLRDRIPLVEACMLVTMFVIGEWFFFMRIWQRVEHRFSSIRVIGYAGLLWMIALFGSFGSDAFIYFQF
ncbi:D-alanyl-lipoteichoic acid acyltransferase DltB, MBOAT superfamily [Neorhodopirellula lusitana]|uniref:D-alanyl-lipoteichoic acid acyltransferase DltB, MBOAT superfamily n=1 Tax=Neorhodopirellula lusitana TaxID=445327 RepID=A0ABY1QFV0_9BACT|nr:MBOAT family O-acyltransferase [Neorhodopirellula lusitana]SMP68241.1 D-alanyl-lipoteichoic acid acyltransferase DltB, MBOAT superfamily [Neorhodopirellula lusitana]